MSRLFFILALLYVSVPVSGQHLFETREGYVAFNSEAPQELIHASSNQLIGVLDAGKLSFAFKISMISFMGFNSPLQREHFNENYMESGIFPEATYKGKIIEHVDLTREGTYEVRTKGKLTIHGIEQERIIRATVINKDGRLRISSNFTVQLADHNIKIPKVVNEKLSPEIQVSVKAELIPRNSTR